MTDVEEMIDNYTRGLLPLINYPMIDDCLHLSLDAPNGKADDIVAKLKEHSRFNDLDAYDQWLVDMRRNVSKLGTISQSRDIRACIARLQVECWHNFLS
jgi:hypothetical protein